MSPATTAPAAPRRQRVQDVAPARLAQLHAGTAATTTLTEGLALDFAALLRGALPDAGEEAAQALERAADQGITRRMALAGELLLARWGSAAAARLQAHASDTVRGWACFVVGAQADVPLAARLDAIRPLADDAHFGVREWAWLALRPHIAADLAGAIRLLAPWTGDASPRVRRFATESTRPRGVWCAHLPALQRDPAPALPLLAPLRADPDAYVQDSVGNWLNDAAKSQPDWVRGLCAQWLAQRAGAAQAAATERICARALRSLR